MTRLVRVGDLEIPAGLLAINPHLSELVSEGRPATSTGARSGPRWRTAVDASAHRDGRRVSIEAKGLRLVSELNTREHGAERGRRAAWQRSLIASALRDIDAPAGPWRVLVVRQGPRLLDSHDNLGASCKHVVDAVASWLRVDDGDRERFVCTVEQTRGRYVVRVVVSGLDAAP